MPITTRILDINQHLYTTFIATSIFKKQLSKVSTILKAWSIQSGTSRTWELSKHLHNTFFIAAFPNKRSLLLKKQYKFFLSLLMPQKKTIGIFYSALETTAFFNSLNYRSSNKIIRHVWAILLTSVPTKWSASSRAPFEPMEKCEMKFRLVSSNFKCGLFIYFVADTWNMLPVMSENDKSAGLWKVKVCSYFEMCLLMVTTYSNNEAGDQS